MPAGACARAVSRLPSRARAVDHHDLQRPVAQGGDRLEAPRQVGRRVVGHDADRDGRSAQEAPSASRRGRVQPERAPASTPSSPASASRRDAARRGRRNGRASSRTAMPGISAARAASAQAAAVVLGEIAGEVPVIDEEEGAVSQPRHRAPQPVPEAGRRPVAQDRARPAETAWRGPRPRTRRDGTRRRTRRPPPAPPAAAPAPPPPAARPAAAGSAVSGAPPETPGTGSAWSTQSQARGELPELPGGLRTRPPAPPGAAPAPPRRARRRTPPAGGRARPASGTTSGFRISTISPLASAIPALAPPAKPRFFPGRSTRTPAGSGGNGGTEPLSTTSSSNRDRAATPPPARRGDPRCASGRRRL